jgi:ornithine cyclodeaminase/alanine dehydrogenase-like protein (mu-crystallin family)
MSVMPERGLRILNTRELASIDISPDEVVDIVERAYGALAAGTSANPRKIKTSPQDGRSVSYSMLGRDGARDLVGFKTSYKHQPIADRDQQAYFTSLQLYDDRTGRPVALLDCARVGAMRTPAVTALLARHCAPPDSATALVVGTGTQGRQALPFLLSTMPGLRRLLVHGSHPDGLRSVVETLAAHHPDREVEIVRDLRAAAGEADIVVATAGGATTAAIESSWLRPGALCILVGHGLAPSTLSDADRVVATSAAQMAVTGTDMADADGNLRAVDAELPDILAGRASGRETPEQRVFAYNSGLVVTDIALGHRLAELAESRGLGQVVELWS